MLDQYGEKNCTCQNIVFINDCLSVFNLKKRSMHDKYKLNLLQLVEVFYPCRKETFLGVFMPKGVFISEF